MTGKVLNRWQAAGAHFLICIAIAVAVVALMLSLWYPRPLFEAAGGTGLLFIVLAVDVTLGPLLTLCVFKAGKRGMKFDLAVIALLQVAALAYGLHVVALARPAFIVFIKDRFDLATVADLDPAELAQAKYPQFRSPPWTGPLLAVADMPTDPAERAKVIDAALAGLDLHLFPKYFVPYGERRAAVLARAISVARLRQGDPKLAIPVDDYLASTGVKESDVRCLMLRTRFAWIVVLVDPKTAEPVKLLLGEKIE